MASDVLRNVEDKMRKSAEGLKKELSTIRTGRASVSIVEHIRVDYASVPTPLSNSLAFRRPKQGFL